MMTAAEIERYLCALQHVQLKRWRIVRLRQSAAPYHYYVDGPLPFKSKLRHSFEQIQSLLEEGLNQSEVAHQLGIARQTVSLIVKRGPSKRKPKTLG